jgi:hypothetical protein
MVLPAHLQKYDGLIDLLVGALVREIETGDRLIDCSSNPETMPTRSAGVVPGRHPESQHEQNTTSTS